VACLALLSCHRTLPLRRLMNSTRGTETAASGSTRERSHRAMIRLTNVPGDYPPSLHARLGLIRWPIGTASREWKIMLKYFVCRTRNRFPAARRFTAKRKVSIASDRPSPSNPPRRKRDFSLGYVKNSRHCRHSRS